MPKKRSRTKVTRKSRVKSKKPMKKKLQGFTKDKGKFALVFKKGKILSMGKSRFSSKKSLVKAASKFLK